MWKIQICEFLYVNNFDAIIQQRNRLGINNGEVISLMCTLPKSWDTFNTTLSTSASKSRDA